MKDYAVGAMLALCLCATAAQAVAQEVMAEREQVSRVMPARPPDAARWQAAMAPGTATIRGVATTRHRLKAGFSGMMFYIPSSKDRRPVESQPVHLMPFDEYTQEWLDLYLSEGGTREVRGEPLRTVAGLDPSLEALRRSIITNSSGDFEFRNVSPGRYLVYAEPEWESDGVVRTGRAAGNTVAGYVHTARVDLAYKIIDVPAGGGVVDADIRSEKIIYEKKTYAD
ncbi:carboxypeptidase-like regulatory domain-containing protein [Coralloluteibacterium stylophorae]|uniref:Carboxypeptidase regulatory-like domain-containing protein n=1 Tax=Coralloluteibacterium stylophorae TaxID=1776034 RepID=A0A8J7VRZ9_9GAMM|nr:carboxypeptidase-like regulatory domain-containing protein [Coralloluteibacterium stylophorae]MBS7457275.1 carboxypeptidase regulatory-like domain-containing protein [Coralloluteibacterium stylophorae]